MAQSAPISRFQPPAAFTEASERAKTLLEKILSDIPAVHATTIHIQVNNAPDWPLLIDLDLLLCILVTFSYPAHRV